MKKIISLVLTAIFVFSIGVISVSADESKVELNKLMLSLLPTNIKASEPVTGNTVITDCGSDILKSHGMSVLHETDITNKQYVKLKNFTENLIKDCNTDLEKVYTISTWVYKNIKYVFGMVAGDSIDTVYGVFDCRVANCEGFTRLTNYMLYLADIPNAIIDSATNGHEWGCALVDGEWIIVDSTNNYIGNDCLDRFTIEEIFFSTTDGLSYVIVKDYTMPLYTTTECKKIMLAGVGFSHNIKVDEIKIPAFVEGIETDCFKYYDENSGKIDNDDLVIKGEKGTYAETYVLKNYACVNYSKNNTFTAYKKHNYKETILKKATCKKDGLKKCVCTICGEKTKRVIKAHHNFKRVSKKSTVFNSGFKNYKICKDCGYEKPFEGKYLSRLSLKNTSFKIIAEKEKIKITYKKINGANGFIVRYKKVGDNKYTYKKFKTTKSAKKYIKNLKKNKKYYISFQVYKNENNKKVLSQWSKTRKITVK